MIDGKWDGPHQHHCVCGSSSLTCNAEWRWECLGEEFWDDCCQEFQDGYDGEEVASGDPVG